MRRSLFAAALFTTCSWFVSTSAKPNDLASTLTVTIPANGTFANTTLDAGRQFIIDESRVPAGDYYRSVNTSLLFPNGTRVNNGAIYSSRCKTIGGTIATFYYSNEQPGPYVLTLNITQATPTDSSCSSYGEVQTELLDLEWVLENPPASGGQVAGAWQTTLSYSNTLTAQVADFTKAPPVSEGSSLRAAAGLGTAAAAGLLALLA